MIFPGIKKISRKLSLYRSNNQTFGLYNNYFIRLGDGYNCKYAIIEFEEIDIAKSNLLTTLIKNKKKRFKFKHFEITRKSISYKFSELIKHFSVKLLKRVVEITIKILQENNIKGSNKCHKCNKNDKISFYHFKSNGLKLCNTCIAELNIEQQKKKEEYINEDKNYGKGILGFLLFGLPGIILGIILYIFLNRIAAVTALVICGLGFRGYLFFGGKNGKFTAAIVSILTIIYVIIGSFLNVYFLLLRSGFEYNLIIKTILNSPKLINGIKINIIISIIMSLLIIIPYTIYFIYCSIFPTYKDAKKI